MKRNRHGGTQLDPNAGGFWLNKDAEAGADTGRRKTGVALSGPAAGVGTGGGIWKRSGRGERRKRRKFRECRLADSGSDAAQGSGEPMGECFDWNSRDAIGAKRQRGRWRWKPA